MSETAPRDQQPHSDRRFARRAALIAAAAALAFAFYHLANVVMMIAGAIVVAVCVHLISDPLNRVGLGRKASIAIAISVLAIAILGAVSFFGVEIARQAQTLFDELPRAISNLQESWNAGPLGALTGELKTNGADAGAILEFGRSFVGGFFTAAVSLIIVITAGIILAVNPQTYRDGLILLFPKSLRERLREAANACGEGLKGWLIGQLIAMAVIGVLTSIGLLAIGMPSWLALGLLAGFAQFVPVVGPFVATVPGVIVAASMDGMMLVKALAVYVGVQQLESNLITPLVMRKTAALPMAVTLISISAFTGLFGLAGAILATPIAVTLYILTRRLYIEAVLGDRLKPITSS